MEGGDEGLHFLSCAYWSLCLDGDNGVLGSGCFCSPRAPLGAESCNMSLLVAVETKSTLDTLLFFFVCERHSGSSVSYVHCVGVSVVECVPPLEFCCSSSSVASFDPLFEVYVFLLVGTGGVCPVVPCDRMVELYTVGD